MLPNSPFQNPTHQAITIGGYDTSTMEVFNGTSWSKMGPELPVWKIGMFCALYTNPTTLFIVSGFQGNVMCSQDTYYLNSLEQKWVPGPKVNTGRMGHGCGRIERDQNSGKLSTIVVGGANIQNVAQDSVEILDDDSSTWRAGPKLPVAASGSAIFKDPRGGLIVVGGNNPSGNFATLYRLRHVGWNAQWETLVPQTKLKVGAAVAIPIPDEIAPC